MEQVAYRLKISKRLQSLASGSQLALRAAAAAGVSVGLARQCGLAYPIYTLLAAVIVTDLSPSQTRRLGLRLIATVVGAAWGAMLGQMLEPSAIVVGTGILVAMLICHFVHADDSAKGAGYISGIAIVAQGKNPWSYALLRLTETTLGILVAWVISFVPTLIRTEKEETESKVD